MTGFHHSAAPRRHVPPPQRLPPPLPEPAANAARAQAAARYDNFVAALERGLNEWPKLRQEIQEDSVERNVGG